MSWYPGSARRRARQALVDLVTLLWVLAWVAVGRGVFLLVAAVAGPVRSLQGAGEQFEESARQAGQRVGELPVVGDPLRRALEGLSGSGASVSSAGSDLADTIERLGLWLGLAVAAGPVLTVAIPWTVARYRGSRRTRAARRLLAEPDGLDLFALRALGGQPLHRLSAISSDPVAAWRRGDPLVTRQLAALELRDIGLRPPRHGPSRAE